MQTIWSRRGRFPCCCAGLLLAGLVLLSSPSCTSQTGPVRVDPNLDPGWPKGPAFWHETPTKAGGKPPSPEEEEKKIKTVKDVAEFIKSQKK